MEGKIKKLVLIDGNALIHRAYHALPPLTTKKGELVNAVYGFASVLLKIINDFKPDYILATFDLKAPTFRHKEFEEYKATRVKAPDDLYQQIGRVKEVVESFNIPIYEKEGFEADDLIGTLAAQSEGLLENVENIIVTGDLDTLQLISLKTNVYALRRGMSNAVLYDKKAVFERYGLEPEQLIDFKGLRGDQSDNIPGVKGIGEKTAIALIQKYGSLENLYHSLPEIKGAIKEKLERDRAQAILSKRLATIVKNVPVALELEKAVTQEFDRKKIIDLFQKLNFFSLIRRLPESNSEKNGADGGYSDGGINVAESSGVKDFKYEVIQKKEANDFFESIKEQKETAIYLTADRLAFSWKTGRAVIIPNIQNFQSEVGNFFKNEKIAKIGYDLKNIYKTLKQKKVELKGDLFDVMLAAYVLNPGGKIEFENLVLEELGEEIEKKENKGQIGMEFEIESEKEKKTCRMADYIFKLHKIYKEKMEKISQEQGENNLLKVFRNVEMPLVEILAGMELEGIKLNAIIFQGISEKISVTIGNLEKSIYELAGAAFNINSPKQLQEVLFEKLKIPTTDIKKIKTGISTASPELTKLKGKHKIIEKVEDYRELFKLKTTYLDVLPTLLDGKSRIHSNFNQAVTATGRLSSSDPNLQNIPTRTDLGQLLRTAFVAEEGWKLVSADYSQIDLRVVAHMSNDRKMIETFLRGEDVHRATAAEVNKVTPSQVTEKMRRAAKALNFGVIYGMSVFGFSVSAGIDRDEAKKFIDGYMEKFEGIARYIRNTKEFAKKNQYVETEIGRRRYIPEINSPNFQVQNSAERMAINMPIQGLAADIVKLAMIEIHEEYKNNSDVRMLLQVHDEIILEAKENIAEGVAKKVKEIMENAYKLKVPLVVDVKIGDNWGEI